jgi:RNA polymerase sigma-70 factor (ECF subfamily)
VVTIEELEAVYRQRYQRFARVARALVGDPERAHDAVQESFARAIRGRAGFRGEGSVEGWLWRTLVNVCADERRRGAHVAPLDAAPEGSGNGHAEEWPELRAAVASLPERQRLMLFLRHYADLDYRAIAEATAVDRGTVAATLHKAHASLRRSLVEAPR